MRLSDLVVPTMAAPQAMASLDDVATLLGVKRRFILRYARRGCIPSPLWYRRVPRWLWSDLGRMERLGLQLDGSYEYVGPARSKTKQRCQRKNKRKVGGTKTTSGRSVIAGRKAGVA